MSPIAVLALPLLSAPTLRIFFERGGVPEGLGNDGGIVNAGGSAGTSARTGIFLTGGTLLVVRCCRAELARCAASPSRDRAGDLEILPDVLPTTGTCMGNDIDIPGEADLDVRCFPVAAFAELLLGIPFLSISGTALVPIIAKTRFGDPAKRLGAKEPRVACGPGPLSFEELVISNSMTSSRALYSKAIADME